MAFLKFIDKRGADSFVSGTVQFGRVKEYLENEQKECAGKNDKFEGKYYTTDYQTPQGTPVRLTIDAKRQNVDYALCLYHLDDKHNADGIMEMFKFGDYVVKIDNESEFDRRIKIGAKNSKYILYKGDIVYYQDGNIEDEMKVMDLLTKGLDCVSYAKRKEIFLYQNEYRYLLVDEYANKKNIRFEIGNIEDVATIMTRSEFLQTL